MAASAEEDSSSVEIARVQRPGTLTRAGVIAGLTLIYFIAGKLGLRFATIHPCASAVWAPTGIALSACLLFGRWVAAAVFVGAFLVNVTTAGSIATSLGIAAGNTLEALAGSYLLYRFAGGLKVFDRTRDVFRFLMLAAIASTLVSATIGVSSLCLGGYARWAEFKWIWLTWWLGDATGALIVAPMLLLWAGSFSVTWEGQQKREAVALLVALVVTGGVVFGGWLPLPKQQYPLDFFCFPILLWAAFRFGPRETATASFILSAIAIVGTLNGLGPFAQGTRNESLLLLQTFAGLTGLMSIAVATAVAERRRLDETRSRLAAIVDSSDDGIIGLNLDGCVTSWNRGATRVFGFSAAEAIGKPVGLILPPERPAEEQEVARLEVGAVCHFETQRKRKDGALIDIALTISPIVGRAGRIIGTSRTSRDITDEKRTRRQREELLAAQHLAREAAEAASRAKDEFLAMLGHELRNPLHAILLAVHLLENTGAINDRGAKAVEIISRQADHVKRLVDDLLEAARVTSGRIVLVRRPTNLSDCVQECIRVFGATGQFERHVVEIDSEPVWVDADSERLIQIVTNLLSNALKYTPTAGRILISVKAETDDAVLRVGDDGIGIPAASIPHIFDLFARGEVKLDRAPGGLGVGLTLVKRLVELHGGSVEAQSDGPGKGSVFIVRLSRIAPPVPLQATPANGLPQFAGGLRILVIEDNADAREGLRGLLELWRHDVSEASDGHAGLDAAMAFHPEVALIDLGLPGLDGYEVARQLRASPGGDKTILIALTGYAQSEDRQRAKDAGFQGYLPKPVDPNRLMQLIAALSHRESQTSTSGSDGQSA
jgi:PAS domain S-box-containing protein